MTELALIVTRAVHVGAAVLLFGELLFAFAIAPHAAPNADPHLSPGAGGIESRLRPVIAWALVFSAVSWAIWLALEATSMAGTSLGQALDVSTMMLVLRESGFGHVWSLRIALLAMLTVVWTLTIRRRTTNDAVERRAILVSLTLAAMYLAMLAFAGHATAATQGRLRVVHLASDASHALAAGAWLGALPAFVLFLGSGQPSVELARGTRAFSMVGITSVAVLLASGIVNAWFLVSSFPGLFGTPYGQLLVLKLALFGAMLSIAAVNRRSLTPRLVNNDALVARLLRRNATLELFGGVLIVIIVGALGTMIPAAHQSPVWPFPFTLDSSLADVGRQGRVALVVSTSIAIAGLTLTVSGVRRRKPRSWIAGSLGLLIAMAISLRVLAIPAFPTTYAIAPVPYGADEVARGAVSFARNCSSCHGAEARGDGPLAPTLSDKPADLVQHVPGHPEGNLFWWIAHGIPKSAMPAFSPALSESEIWEIVQWLEARSAAEGASAIGSTADPEPQFRVPDFAYEVMRQGQQTLLLQQPTPALIVLYALPQSSRRLKSLDSDDRLLHANVRIIAIPLEPTQRVDAPGLFVQFVTSPTVASVYAMFAGPQHGAAPVHAELLVDGTGFLRARWIGVPDPASDRTAAIVSQAEHLALQQTAIRRRVHHMH